MDNFSAKLQRIFDILKQIESKNNFTRQIGIHKLLDLELIAIDLTAEYMGINSEGHLFRLLPKGLSSKIDRTVYNRRERKLFAEKIRLQRAMSKILTGEENYFMIDSMP